MKPEFSRVFIKDDLGDILVLKDRKRKGIWNIPGGKQEINETPIDCAIRELREELALEISELEEIYHADLVFDDVVWSANFYFAGVVKGRPTLNEPHKIEGVQFISDLEQVSFSKDLQPLFDYLKASDILQDKVTEWR